MIRIAVKNIVLPPIKIESWLFQRLEGAKEKSIKSLDMPAFRRWIYEYMTDLINNGGYTCPYCSKKIPMVIDTSTWHSTKKSLIK